MKLRNSIFIVNSEGEGFLASFNRLMDQKLPIKISYELAKLGREVSNNQETYEASRLKILDKYGKKNEEDNTYTIPAKNQDKANEEFNELANMEEKYSIKAKVKLPKDIEMAPRDLAYLDEIIEVE